MIEYLSDEERKAWTEQPEYLPCPCGGKSDDCECDYTGQIPNENHPMHQE